VLRFCIKSATTRYWEHNAFTFKIRVARHHQPAVHATGSLFFIPSAPQRYCVEDAFAFYTPPAIAQNPEALARWQSFQQDVQSIYDFFLQGRHPAGRGADGPVQRHRKTVFFMTMNARELRHFFCAPLPCQPGAG
jgi:thymidylate synthase (FAD)